jgi:hypothetical protein
VSCLVLEEHGQIAKESPADRQQDADGSAKMA